MLLAWGEQAGSGVEHTAGLVEGVCAPAAPMVEFLLDAPATLIESITGEVYDVEGVHNRSCVWELFSSCAFEPTPMTPTPSKRSGSPVSMRWPSPKIAVLAVFHDTAKTSAMRATVRW